MSMKRVLYLLLVGCGSQASLALAGPHWAALSSTALLRSQPARPGAGPSRCQHKPAAEPDAQHDRGGNHHHAGRQGVGPAVVTVVGTIPGQQTFFGRTSDGEVSGSGFFVSDKGYVITNNHVVEGTQSVHIILSDGSEQPATVVGTDKYNDIAVLKSTGPVPAVATLGDSDVLQPGESVIAIGSPLGDFKNSVTVGVVSATGRSIDTGQGYQVEGLVQTDAAINQGNSGGPLVNLAGQVIGVNTLIVRGNGNGAVAEGLGFAIPIDTAQAVASQIIDKGYFAHPFLGITYQPITPAIATPTTCRCSGACTSAASPPEPRPATRAWSTATSSRAWAAPPWTRRIPT